MIGFRRSASKSVVIIGFLLFSAFFVVSAFPHAYASSGTAPAAQTASDPTITITTLDGSKVCGSGVLAGGTWNDATHTCSISSSLYYCGLTINAMTLDIGVGVAVTSTASGGNTGICNQGTIKNYGSMTGISTNGNGIFNAGTIDNYGTISSEGAEFGINNGGTINNLGTISGINNLYSFPAAGISNGFGNKGTINNLGTISGDGIDTGIANNIGVLINNAGRLVGHGGAYGIYNIGAIHDYCGATSSGSFQLTNPPTVITCHKFTFDQSGVPSGVTWGVTASWGPFVVPFDHTGTGPIIAIAATGSLDYSYDTPFVNSGTTYTCTTGCTGTASVTSDTIFSAIYNDNTITAVACSPSSVAINTPITTTTCTARVTGSLLTGAVTFTSSSSTGTFTPPSGQCVLTAGACSVAYSDTTMGTATITASYGGDSNNAPSSGTFSFDVAMLTLIPASSHGSTVCGSGVLAGGTWNDVTFTCSFGAPGLAVLPGTVLDMGPGVTISSTYGIINRGTINNYGTITATGPESALIPDPTGIINYGTINNYGTMAGENYLSVCIGNGIGNSGTINNYGTITATNHGGTGIINSGTIDNVGTMAANTGVFFCGGTGFSNSGTIDNVGTITGSSTSLSNSGTIDNIGTMAGSATPAGNTLFGISNYVGTINDYCGASPSYSSYEGTPPNAIGCHTVTFEQTGIPSNVAWGVTISWGPFPVPVDHASTGASVAMQAGGPLNYSYDSPVTSSGVSYECIAGCTGTASVTADTSSAASYFTAVKRITTTVVACSPSSGITGSSVSCTATVTDTSSTSTPSGTISFSSVPTISSLNLPSSCSLVPVNSDVASCSVSFTPGSGSQASYIVNATYSGDSAHSASSGTSTLIVDQPNTSAQGSTTTEISGGSVSSNQTSTTGVSVSITGTSAPSKTNVTITTEELNSQSTGVTASILTGSQYYDVSVQGITTGTATVCITTTNQMNSIYTIQYWDGSGWANATNISISGSTICGDIPVSALTGTNIVVGQMTYSITFDQTGIPSSVTWSVTVGTNTYSGQGSITVPNLQGTLTYSYESSVSGTTGTRYECNSQTCSGTIDSSTNSVTSSYQTQYLISFSQTGSSSAVNVQWDFGNGTSGTNVSPFAIWADASTSNSLSYTYPSSLAGGSGIQYELVSVSPTSIPVITAPATITGSYQTQYLITFNQVGSGSPVTVSYSFGGGNSSTGSVAAGSGIWVDASTTSISFTYPATVPGDTGTRYALTSVDTTSPLTISSPATITGTYGTQYLLTVSGGNNVQVNPSSADGWYNAGTSLSVSSDWTWNLISGQSRTAITNYQIDGNGQNPARQGSGTLTSSQITMDGPHTITFLSTTQYYVTLTTKYGTASLTVSQTGDNWFDSGSKATFSVNTPVSCETGCREEFTAWAGTGASSYTGTNNPETITVNGAVTETAGWQLQYFLTVSTSPTIAPSPISPPSASGWYNAGTTVKLTANNVTGYVFIDWNLGVTSGTLLASTTTVTMNGPHSLVAYYETPTTAVQTLLSTVNTSSLQHGTQTSLDAKLNAALNSLNSGNTKTATNQLNAFINAVNAQSGKHIKATQAELLTSFAQDIINSL